MTVGGREQGRLAGRTTELAQLERIFRDSRDERTGRGRCVFLSGGVGIGKTRLARFFLRHTADVFSDAITVSAQCIEGESANRPYGPFRDVLAQLSGMRSTAGIGAIVRREVPGWLPGASQAAGRAALFEQFSGLCGALGRQRPLAILIDDLHWADRSSLDLLTHLANSLTSVPAVLLCTLEAEGAVDTIRGILRRIGANGIEFALPELEGAEIGEVAEAVLDGSLGSDVADWLAGAAGGVPLRAEQYIRWLSESGGLRKRLFRYALRSGGLPSGREETAAIVSSRLDALEPTVRWTLEASTLVGSVIDSIVVANQMGKTGDEVHDQLRRAESEYGLIEAVGERRWATGSRSVRFVFRHPIVRQTLRERITEKRRVHLLARAAQKLEQLAGDGAAEIADEIAALHLAAGAKAESHVWALKAADLAERLHAIYEVDEFLQSAARTAGDELERLRIDNRLARVYSNTDREALAQELLEDVHERARALKDPASEVSAGVRLGWLRLERGDSPLELVQRVGRLVETARSADASEELVMALDLSCVAAERLGRAEEALLMAEESLYVAERNGNAETVAQAAYRLAAVHVSWGNPEEGRVLAQRALEVFEGVGDGGGVALCHELLGLANFRAGDWDGALHHWESALESMEVAGMPDQKIAMQVNIAELLTLRGGFERALRLFQSGLKLAEELADPQLARRCQAGIARLEFERGDYPAVLELTERIREVMPESGAWREDFQTTAIRALAYLELGDELQAWQEAARLEQLYQGKEGWFERRAEGDAVRMRVIDLDSDAWLAGMVAQQGIGETVDKDPYGEGFLQYHQAHVMTRDRPAEARQAAERAAELFGRLGAEPMLARTRRLLDLLPRTEARSTQASEEKIEEERIDQWFEGLEG